MEKTLTIDNQDVFVQFNGHSWYTDTIILSTFDMFSDPGRIDPTRQITQV